MKEQNLRLSITILYKMTKLIFLKKNSRLLYSIFHSEITHGQFWIIVLLELSPNTPGLVLKYGTKFYLLEFIFQIFPKLNNPNKFLPYKLLLRHAGFCLIVMIEGSLHILDLKPNIRRKKIESSNITIRQSPIVELTTSR